MDDQQLKRVFAAAVLLLIAVWLGSYINGQIKLHQAEQKYMKNIYQPLGGK